MTNPVAVVRSMTTPEGEQYDTLVFWCPGCERLGEDGEYYGGAHALPISGDSSKRPVWQFDGNLEAPTLQPSILSRLAHRHEWVNGAFQDVGLFVCHSFLKAGVFDYLQDCTHRFTGQQVPMPPLPDWLLGLD